MAERSAPIHAGPDVDRLAGGMGARAFSFDGHVFLGRSARTSADAPRILRHELDHAEHGAPETLYADQQAGALDSAVAFGGSTLESMVPVVADYLPAELSGVLKTALALEKLRGQISSLSTTFVTQAKASLAGLPTAVQGSLREHGAPTWFTDTVFPFLVEAGGVVLEMAGSMLWEVFRDIVAPHWGVFTQDLPALWKGVQRIWAGIRALDYREILAGQSDVEQSLLSAAGRFELALGVWLFLIGALAGGGVGATVGGGGSAAVSAGAAAPAGAGAGGGVGGGVGGATTAAVAEALGLALVAGQFASDAKAIATSLLSWATSDEPEKQTQYLNEAVTAAFRAGSIIVMMGLAFAAVKVSRFVARIVRPLLERPATRELIERASLRMRSLLKGAPETPKPARLPGSGGPSPHPSAGVVEGARPPISEAATGHAPTPEPARAVELGGSATSDGLAGATPKVVMLGEDGNLIPEGKLTPKPPSVDELPQYGIQGAKPRAGTPERPVSFQGDRPTCGPVSCEMIASMTGPVEPQVLARMLRESGRLGVTSEQMVTMLRWNKIVAEAKSGWKVADLAAATESGNPAIAMIRTSNPSHPVHAVVVDGVTVRDGIAVVAVRNPWGIQYFQPASEFAKIFIGNAVKVLHWL